MRVPLVVVAELQDMSQFQKVCILTTHFINTVSVFKMGFPIYFSSRLHPL